MLQELLKDLQTSLKSYNQGLAKQNLLVDIPWTMVDGELNIQRLIFRKDKTLYIVKEGEINESKWEYLSELDSLVIELGGKKILMNEIYSDTKALILKKDGSSHNFLAFANHKELPDLNLVDYFNETVKRLEPTQPIIENEQQSIEGAFLITIFAILILIVLAFIGMNT